MKKNKGHFSYLNFSSEHEAKEVLIFTRHEIKLKKEITLEVCHLDFSVYANFHGTSHSLASSYKSKV